MLVSFVSNLAAVMSELDERMRTAGEVIGAMAEGNAKQNLTDNKSVDTGRLRNSVAHGLAGGSLSIDTYTDNSGKVVGDYGGGNIPADSAGKYVVVIGSNVLYAPFVELGTIRSNPKPYLRPAIEQHIDEYKAALQDILAG